MMTAKPPRSDFSRVDWARPEIGRITVRTGATTRDELRQYTKLLDTLYAEGQYDVLRSLRGRGRATVRLDEVRAEIQRTGDFGVANTMARVLLAKDAWAVLGAASRRLGHSEATRERYGYTLQKLVKLGVVVPGTTKVRDLAHVDWRALRPKWTGKRGQLSSASDWNHLRRFLSSALTDLFGGGRTGEHHPFRQRVLDRFPSEQEHEREVTITLAEFTQLVSLLPEKARPAVLTLAFTGVRWGEYESLTPDRLDHAVPGLRVTGKTGPGIVRVDPSLWPWVIAAVPAPMQEGALRRALTKAATAVGHPELRIHDLRHLSAVAAMAAGAGLDAVREHLRHADAMMTMRYLKGARREEAAAALARAFAPTLRAVGGGND
jgi:integrase